jgi:hypothetical protein
MPRAKRTDGPELIVKAFFGGLSTWELHCCKPNLASPNKTRLCGDSTGALGTKYWMPFVQQHHTASRGCGCLGDGLRLAQTPRLHWRLHSHGVQVKGFYSKSNLVDVLLGLIRPSSGVVLIAAQNIN